MEKPYVVTFFLPDGKTKVYNWGRLEGAVMFALRWCQTMNISVEVRYRGLQIVMFNGPEINSRHKKKAKPKPVEKKPVRKLRRVRKVE